MYGKGNAKEKNVRRRTVIIICRGIERYNESELKITAICTYQKKEKKDDSSKAYLYNLFGVELLECVVKAI